jgi:hypothetical protein
MMRGDAPAPKGETMPKFDGNGPGGNGPMTGRGGGYCVIPLNTTAQELEFLRNQEHVLKKQLKCVGNRIQRIQKDATQKEVAR